MNSIKVINKSNNELPSYATPGSSGMDVRAYLDGPISLQPGSSVCIPTGLYFEIPEGLEVQVRSRSGLAVKNQVVVLNSPGTIDSDYRGELKVILFNLGSTEFIINSGDRIAQLVVQEVIQPKLIEVSGISETSRASGGFGHSGVK